MTDPAKAAQELQSAYQQAQGVLVKLARADVNEFCAYVLRDEQTHKPIDQGPTHRKMQALCDKYRRLILWSYTGAGKTQQIAIARTLWVLRDNPRARVIIISNTKDMAAKIVRSVANYIQNSPEFRDVAPDVREGNPWTSTSLYLRQADGGFAKDASVQACGVHGNLTGSRCEVMIWDDILDPEIVRTQASRDDLHAWLKSAAVLGRVDPHVGRVWCIGNAYHPDDSLHRFVEEGWHFARLPVVDERGRSTWPERWPMHAIQAKRKELGPLEFARQMLCRARDDSEARFKRDHLLACAARGRGLVWTQSAADLCGTPWPLPPGALDYLPPAPALPADGLDVTAAADATGPGNTGRAGGRGTDTATPDATPQHGPQAAHTTRAHASVYTPPARAPRSQGPAMATTAKGQGQAGHGPRSLVDDVHRLFPDAHLLAAKERELLPLEAVPVDTEAPAWLRERQEGARKEREREGVRGSRRGASGLHARAGAASAVLDRGTTAPSAPGKRAHDAHASVQAETTGPGDNANTQARTAARPNVDTQAPGVPDLMDGARLSDRALDALAGEGPHGSVVAAVGAGALPVDEAAVALDVVTATRRLGGAVQDLRANRPVQPQRTGADLNGTGAEKPGLPPGPAAPPSSQARPHPLNTDHTPTAENLDMQAGGGAHAAYVSTRVRTSDEVMRYGGLTFPADAGEWLDAWAAAPGTPHRRGSDLYPMHPRSLVGLRRMGVQFHTGVDLAVQRHSAADWTVLYTIAVYPAWGPDGHALRRVCEIDRGKYGPTEIIRRILSVRQRYGGKVLVENNAAQQYIIDLIIESAGNAEARADVHRWLRGFTTGKQKASPEFGIESLAAEFAREQWCWPVDDDWHANGATPPQLERNWNEILFFDPREHTGDVLMAQWFARESARMDEPKRRKRPQAMGVRVF